MNEIDALADEDDPRAIDTDAHQYARFDEQSQFDQQSQRPPLRKNTEWFLGR